MSVDSVAVHILDREYRIACNTEDREHLLRAAMVLDHRMRALKTNNKTLTFERIAVLAALTLAHEGVQTQAGETEVAIRIDVELKRMNARLDAVLSRAED